MSQAEAIKKSLDVITDKYNLQGEVVKGLQETVKKLEERFIALQFTANNVVNNGNPVGFTNQESAKSFVQFVNKVMFTPESLKTANTATASEGGFLVNEEFSNTLIRLVEVFGVVRRGARIIPMSGQTLNLKSLVSGVTAYWVDEAAAITESQPAFGKPVLTNKKLAVLVGITGEMEDDSAIPMANLIATLTAEALAEEEDRVGLIGDVTGNSDAFNGIAYTSGVAQIQMVATKTAFTDVTFEDMMDLTINMKPSAIAGAKFYLNRTVLGVLRKIRAEDTTGKFMMSDPSGTTPGNIWEYPYELLDVMPAVADTAVDTPFIIFGNLKNLFMGDRKKMTMARSNGPGFANDITHLRFIERVGFLVGQPEGFKVLRTAAA